MRGERGLHVAGHVDLRHHGDVVALGDGEDLADLGLGQVLRGDDLGVRPLAIRNPWSSLRWRWR